MQIAEYVLTMYYARIAITWTTTGTTHLHYRTPGNYTTDVKPQSTDADDGCPESRVRSPEE